MISSSDQIAADNTIDDHWFTHDEVIDSTLDEIITSDAAHTIDLNSTINPINTAQFNRFDQISQISQTMTYSARRRS